LKNPNFNELIKDYGIIYFNNHNHIEKKINKKDNNSIIKIITIKSLKEEIDNFKPRTFNFFLENGLNKKSDPKSTISIITKNRTTKEAQIKYYSFIYNNNISENDIPFYHPGAPDGFSIFCTQSEYMQVLLYIKTDEYQNQLQRKKEKEIEKQILKTEPEPNKNEFLCQICRSRFNNYLEHIKSNLHERNKNKYNNSFKKIKLTFKRIAEFKKEQKNNIKLIKEEKKEKINQIIITDNTLMGTTKDESFSLIDDNKVMNITKDKDLKKISEVDNENSFEKYKDFSMKEILNILNGIDATENKGKNKDKYYLPKRNKFEKNKCFLTEDYIHDLKKITGKIHHYNNLINNNN
jgi:hypothetical protein